MNSVRISLWEPPLPVPGWFGDLPPPGGDGPGTEAKRQRDVPAFPVVVLVVCFVVRPTVTEPIPKGCKLRKRRKTTPRTVRTPAATKSQFPCWPPLSRRPAALTLLLDPMFTLPADSGRSVTSGPPSRGRLSADVEEARQQSRAGETGCVGYRVRRWKAFVRSRSGCSRGLPAQARCAEPLRDAARASTSSQV